MSYTYTPGQIFIQAQSKLLGDCIDSTQNRYVYPTGDILTSKFPKLFAIRDVVIIDIISWLVSSYLIDRRCQFIFP